ncbi:serine hydrolase [uncultured Erythrobacter sp.]|uniref:serine hydrolase domain-containing protein n=1 Tax=uncultured Erythrobacter sp. TaxID=263913 RepID=UPI00261F761D|nr:serine hydrolase domain-containing protein [uncultured Erythrobacter sp.]
MTIRKVFIACALTGLAVLGSSLFLFGHLDPTLDSAFEEKLAAAENHQAETLIAQEAKSLGITALDVATIKDGETARTLHFGRSKEGALMQAASLSKAVAAAVILIQAEQENVELDDDIRIQITSFDITKLNGGDRPVTLRQLLSHTAGASQSGYAGYPRGNRPPSIAEVISSPPRFFEFALAFDGPPDEFRYSGGGYSLAQLWAQDVSGKGFTQLADELLLRPLNMKHSTFEQPIENGPNWPLKITGADARIDPTQALFSPLTNSWHNYPEQAAAGLWTTSEDYARFALALVRASEGQENAIPPSVAEAMMTPQVKTGWETDTGPSHYGLGTMLELDEDGALLSVSHTGANAGYRSHFLARPAAADTPAKVIVSIGNTPSAAPLNKAIVNGLNQN